MNRHKYGQGKKGHKEEIMLTKVELEKQERDVKQYDQIFKDLKNNELRGENIHTADQLVKKFKKLKEEHHKYYKYIHELSEEHDSIQEQMRSINHWIQRMKRAKKTRKNVQRQVPKNKKKREIKAYNSQILKNDLRFKKLSVKRNKIMKIMQALRISIGIIFDRIGCAKDTQMEKERIDEGNMLQYMSYVERRTNEILQMYETCQNDGFEFEEKKEKRPMEDSQKVFDQILIKKTEDLNKQVFLTEQDKSFSKEVVLLWNDCFQRILIDQTFSYFLRTLTGQNKESRTELSKSKSVRLLYKYSNLLFLTHLIDIGLEIQENRKDLNRIYV